MGSSNQGAPVRATIESGSIVSHYRIITPLGAGGMGEVYKAHDPRLDRAIALKILPPHLVRNDERVRRFVQEAKSASALNHPHIVTIHEIGESRVSSADGEVDDTKPIHYIAMELIDGFTLRNKIHDQEVDLRTLLSYLAQAAEGLAKAHAAGIVHRDLKPDNIMITRDGFAKVLDFGLAKLMVKKSAAESQETAVRDETREGAVLGTVAYMSPEQVSGKTADHRSDIFSFGTLLYEACTRERPFVADSDVDVMHKIRHDKPVPVDELNPKVPGELRRMIRRCMAKDPDKRFQSMKDVAIELAEVVEEFDELSVTRSSGSITGPIPPRRRMGVRIAATALALLALGAIGFGVTKWIRARRSPAAQIEYSAMKIQPLTFTGNVTVSAISPDGKYLVHVTREEGESTLKVRQIATGTDVAILGPTLKGINTAVFSPEGDYVYYTQRDRETGASTSGLYQIPALGGTPHKLVHDVNSPVAFSPDGNQIAYMRGQLGIGENHLLIANRDGTGERRLAAYKRVDAPRRPAWSPDGKKIVTQMVDLDAGYRAWLSETDVATRKVRKIGVPWRDMTDVQWMPDGRSIAMTATDLESKRSQLWLQPYPEGAPVRLTNDANDYYAASITADGRSIAAVQQIWDIEFVAVRPNDPSSVAPLVRKSNNQIAVVSVARTGAIVCGFRTTANDVEVGLIDGPGQALRPLTSGKRSWDPVVSADGRTIVFTSDLGDRGPHIFAIDADGSRRRQITNGKGEHSASVSGDGRIFSYVNADNELWIANIDGGSARRISNRVQAQRPVLSADGKLVVFVEWPANGGPTSLPSVKVVPVDGGDPLLELPDNAGWYFRFHPNGQELLATRGSRGATNIWSIPLRGGEPVQLTTFEKGGIWSFDLMPDGRLAIVRAQSRTDLVLITDFRR